MDCAAELARLAALEARLAGRVAEHAVARCKDRGHEKAIEQLERAVQKQTEKVARHCLDAETKREFLIIGAFALAIALTVQTGGLSWGWAIAEAIR